MTRVPKSLDNLVRYMLGHGLGRDRVPTLAINPYTSVKLTEQVVPLFPELLEM